jgi:hypothetical protein
MATLPLILSAVLLPGKILFYKSKVKGFLPGFVNVLLSGLRYNVSDRNISCSSHNQYYMCVLLAL